VGYPEKVVVIGAGISGLSCAFRLKQFGLRPLVLESSARAGGMVATVRRDGFLFELGPQCPRFPESVWTLLRDLHLDAEFVPGDPNAKRYVLKKGKLHLAPFSPGGLLFTRLVDTKSKLRILAEAFGHSSPPREEESLAEFVKRKFGTGVVDYLVDPFISTIFFGDARKMGMTSAFPALVEWEHNHGSLVRGALHVRKSSSRNLRVTDALPSLGSFKSGMATLPERLADELRDKIKYGQKIDDVSPAPKENGTSPVAWEIRTQDGEQITSESLVLAVPAHAAASLLQKSVPELAALLNAIEYAPVCVVSSAYDRSVVSHPLNGFGFMTPRVEALQTICTFWNSSLFPGHAPDGRALMTSFAGREVSDPIFKAPEEECAQIVEAENARILGITGHPTARVVWRHLRALPQFNVGHSQRVTRIAEVLRALPNLHLAGNFLTGRSIGDCIQAASQVAENLHSHFR
jgi:protoporphyrinogen/coproporphyrinogen III oxidase